MRHRDVKHSTRLWEVGAIIATFALATSVAKDAEAIDCSKVPDLIAPNDGDPPGLLANAYENICPSIGTIGSVLGILDTVQAVVNVFTGLVDDGGRQVTADEMIIARLDNVQSTLEQGFSLINDDLTLLALDDFVETVYSAREAFDKVGGTPFPVPSSQRSDFEGQLSVARNDSLDALQAVESIVRNGAGLIADPIPGESAAQRQQRLRARDVRRATVGYVTAELYAATLGLHLASLRMTEQAVNPLLLTTYSERLERASSYIYLLIGSKAEACGHGFGAARDQMRLGSGGDLHVPSVRNTYQRSLINSVFYGPVTAAFDTGTSCNLTTGQCRLDFADRTPGAPVIFPCSQDRTGYFNACFDTANQNRDTVFTADPAVVVLRQLMARINTRFGYIDKGVPFVGTIPQPDVQAGAFFDAHVYDDVGYASRAACEPANGNRYYIHEY